MEAAALTLQTARQAAEVQYHLRDLLIAELDRQQFGGVVALGEADRPKPPVDTVVEVWINGMTLTAPADGDFNINPRLTLHLSSGMRILRGDVEVGALSLTREGQRHTLLDWSDDYAKNFRVQITRESEELAKEFVDRLLSRPIPTQHSGPSVRYGTVKSVGEENVVVIGKEHGRDATWTFIVDTKTAIRKGGHDVSAASLTLGDDVVVYSAPGSAVAQLISVVAPPNSSKPAQPEPAEKK
jgi:hypothetical protein